MYILCPIEKKEESEEKMKHPIYTVSNATLRSDINSKKSLARRTYSMSRYMKEEQLEKRSEHILDSFAEGYLNLEKDQYKVFARYIDTFGRWQKNACYKRLQTMVDFDIEEYLEISKLSPWQRFYQKRLSQKTSATIKVKTPRQLKKEMARYVAACRKYDEDKSIELRNKAEKYVKDFLDNKFALPKEDENTFKNYIKTILYPVIAGDIADRALIKIREHNYQVAEKSQESLWDKASARAEKIFGGIQAFFSNTADKIVTFPHKVAVYFARKKESWNNRWQQIKTSFKLPKLHKFSFAMSEKSKTNLMRAGKVLGLVTLLTAGTYTTRECASETTQDNLAQNKTEMLPTAQKMTNIDTARTFHFEPVSNLNIPTFKPIELNTSQQETKPQIIAEETAETPQQQVRAAVINHHEHILTQRLGEKGKKKLYADINNQIENGIFTLPDSLGVEDFAYALAMYRAYGVESSLQNARTTAVKLNAAENAQVIKDIVDAGQTGLGVKKKAEQIRLSLNKGPLDTNNGLYNRMSPKNQHKHNMNLQQWRQARRLAQAQQ